jgi:hypothetical protein
VPNTACERKHIMPVESVVRQQYEQRFHTQNQAMMRQVKPAR